RRPTACARWRARHCASVASRRTTRTGCASCATAPTSSTSWKDRAAMRPVRQVAGHVARKRFGQHFLADRSVVAAIVAAVDPREGQTIVEIGPGLAALTEALMDRVPHLHAVEIDRDLASRLRRRWGPERLSLHESDALHFD